MNKWTKAFCWTILRLEYIPRYKFSGPAEWKWQKHGHWGLNLLDNMNLLWKYIDATNPPDQKLDEEYYDS